MRIISANALANYLSQGKLVFSVWNDRNVINDIINKKIALMMVEKGVSKIIACSLPLTGDWFNQFDIPMQLKK